MGEIKVFISYRRSDCSDEAKAIAEELGEEFGKESIFIDVEDIPPGSDFAAMLLRAVRICEVLIVIIGPHWLSVCNQAGQRRIEDPMDFVRLEIAEALSRGVPIIPVLVEGASMPAENDLPKKVRRFHRRQALLFHRETYQKDVEVLTKRVRELLEDAKAQSGRQMGVIGVRDYFDLILPFQLRARSKRADALATEIGATIQFKISGEDGGDWALILDNTGPRVSPGIQRNPNLVINMTSQAMKDVLAGQFDAREKVASGKVSISGDRRLLRQVGSLVFGG